MNKAFSYNEALYEDLTVSSSGCLRLFVSQLLLFVWK